VIKNLSDWHEFDPNNRKTYPKVEAPVQVRFDDGRLEEGDSRRFFPVKKSSIEAWRYIKSIYPREHA
jgi:hypothetical protein